MDSLLHGAVDEFNKLDNKPIKIIAHLDADGISSGAILVKALLRKNKKFVLQIVKQLTENILKELKQEDYNTFIFIDLGSGYVNSIRDYLKGKNIFIFDHHIPESFDGTGIVHVNPHLVNIANASSTISGAGVVYLFCKGLDKENMDMAHIAVIGAIGDMQNFEGMNSLILRDAINSNKLEIKKGLKMFGFQTRPLSKVLMYSTDPYIPGITGNESASVNFLTQLGIALKDGDTYRTLASLNEGEMKKLVTGIILRRMGSEDKPEDIIGDIYLLKEEENESVTKDAKEFSTLLNSCGRMDKPSLGIGLCLNNSNLKNKAIDLLKDYRIEIIKSLDWFYNNKKSFIEDKNVVIINAGANIKDTIIGTLCSIISKSYIYPNSKIIIGMAYTLDNKIKISARLSTNVDIDLKAILTEVIGEGNVGGHKFACGAFVDLEKEDIFIKKFIGVSAKCL